jgi:hypothetical protein
MLIMQLIMFIAAVIACAAFLALLEIQIEGAAGWAANLPTWKSTVHRLPSLPVVVHPLFPSYPVPGRHHTLFGSFRAQTLLLLFLVLGGRRFSLVCFQPCLRIKEIQERAYLVACRFVVDLHA